MEMVLFIGIQGSGKSTFYLHRFFHTHVRVNGDMLKTAHREKLLVHACLQGKQPFVIDKVNARRDARAPYIALAKNSGFKITGYFFPTDVKPAIARNQQREGTARVPVPAIYGTAKRLQAPEKTEGFDELFTVQLDATNQFVVTPFDE